MNTPLVIESEHSLPEQPRMYFPDGNYITSFDALKEEQKEGFVELLIEQKIAHNSPINKTEYGAAAAIGSEFQASLLCGEHDGRLDVIKGMTTTKEAHTAGGHLLYLEDIVVIPSERRKGLARRLIEIDLLNAWQQGLDGYAWETGRNNEPAHHLYEKIDPLFNVDNLHDVWEISERQRHSIAFNNNLPTAHLAGFHTDVDRIFKTLEDQGTERKVANIIHLLQQQDQHRNNGFSEPAFIVASDTGTFAITSIQYSTFEASTRADTRLYGVEDIVGVMKTVSTELVRRRKRGGIHFEFGNNLVGLNAEMLEREKEKIGLAEHALEHTLGAAKLVHDGSTMVAYQLVGKRYVAAVLEAFARNPNYEFSNDRRLALVNEAFRHGLEYAQMDAKLEPSDSRIDPEASIGRRRSLRNRVGFDS